MVKIIDCITFDGDIDGLQLMLSRMKELNDVIDKFIIVESTKNLKDEHRDCMCELNSHLFIPYLHKINYFKIENSNLLSDSLLQSLKIANTEDDDTIIISNINEIPNPSILKQSMDNKIYSLSMDTYYYDFEHKGNEQTNKTLLLKYRTFTELTKTTRVKDISKLDNSIISSGGWYLKYFTDIKTELARQRIYVNQQYIDKCRKNKEDIFNKDIKIQFIKLQDNKYLPKMANGITDTNVNIPIPITTESDTKEYIKNIINDVKPKKILFSGWIHIPHSYAIVFCQHLISMYKEYPNIEFYVRELKYASDKWKPSPLIYGEHNSLLENKQIFKEYKDNTQVDLHFTISYPHHLDILKVDGKEIPTYVFYTAEFEKTSQDFRLNGQELNDIDLYKYISDNKNLYFVTPSIFSQTGMTKYNVKPEKNIVIPHGVDTNVFKPSDIKSDVFKMLSDDDIVMLSLGSMTSNKGTENIIKSLHYLVNKFYRTEFKLLLKGCSELYESQSYIENVISSLPISSQEKERLLKHIIFMPGTMTNTELNILYNTADLYIAPYIVEGFCLPILEALACGKDVVVPKYGSTREYVKDIYDNGGQSFIHYVETKVEGRLNVIDITDLLYVLLRYSKKQVRDNKKMLSYIEENYSWKKINKDLIKYFG